MSTLMNVDVSLKEVVEEIGKGNFLIPNFQRGFVWNTTDVESLGDSIIRGYPISSMLTMPANGNLKVTYTPLKASGAQAIAGPNAHYVLDGQQRMTSLAKLFLGYDEEKEYYFDMLSILEDKYPEDRIERMPAIQERLQKKNTPPISSELCRAFKKSPGETCEARQHHRFIHGKMVVENRFGSAVSRFLRAFEGVPESVIDKYTDYLNAVFGAMGGYGIPFTKINADSDLGLVIRVFEKVNTSGKKLTLFDLVNAKSFESKTPEYQGGLSEFMNDALVRAEKNPEYSSSAIKFFFEKKATGNGEEYTDLAPFVRCASITEYLKRDATPSISNKEMLAKDANSWFESWKENSDSLLKFVSKLDQEGVLQLINGTFVEYMSAIVMVMPKLLNEPRFMKEVKRYGLHMILSDQTFSKTNMSVVMEFFALGKHLISAHEFEKHKHTHLNYTTSVPAERLEKCGPSYQLFKAIMYILYNEKCGGMFTVDIAGNPIKTSNIAEMDQHHIYPRARTKKEEDVIFNSVANIVLLDRVCNQNEVKDKKAFDYFGELAKIHGVKGDYVFSQNLIPKDIYENEYADPLAVLNKRLEMIVDLVNDYFQSGAQRPSCEAPSCPGRSGHHDGSPRSQG